MKKKKKHVVVVRLTQNQKPKMFEFKRKKDADEFCKFLDKHGQIEWLRTEI